MTVIEKGVIGGIVFCLVVMIGSCSYLIYKVDQAGGIKKAIIETGKEVKDMAREIAKD